MKAGKWAVLVETEGELRAHLRIEKVKSHCGARTIFLTRAL